MFNDFRCNIESSFMFVACQTQIFIMDTSQPDFCLPIFSVPNNDETIHRICYSSPRPLLLPLLCIITKLKKKDKDGSRKPYSQWYILAIDLEHFLRCREKKDNAQSILTRKFLILKPYASIDSTAISQPYQDKPEIIDVFIDFPRNFTVYRIDTLNTYASLINFFSTIKGIVVKLHNKQQYWIVVADSQRSVTVLKYYTQSQLSIAMEEGVPKSQSCPQTFRPIGIWSVDKSGNIFFLQLIHLMTNKLMKYHLV